MDNLTHSLAGALSAELLRRFVPEHLRPQKTGALFLGGILANNVPDLDFLYSGITAGKLGYLLHHRGHTHTFVVAAGLSLILAAAFSAWSLRWKKELDPGALRRERLLLLAVCLAGTPLHVLMDLGNSYGVHPFWPFDNRWFFGDTIFIIEPLLWIVLGLLFAFTATSKVLRAACAGIAVLGMAFVTLLPVPWSGVVVASAVLVGCGFAFRKLGDGKRRVSLALGLVGLVYAVQAGAGARIEAKVRQYLLEQPELHALDWVRTPTPSTPWCWQVLLIGRTNAPQPEYVLRMGRVSLLPWLDAAADCPAEREQISAPVQLVAQPVKPGWVWDFEYRTSLQSLDAVADNCWFRAFLRFSRAPFFDSSTGLIGDLRFDRSADDGFSEFRLSDTEGCPRFVPPWTPPRRDVFDVD